MGLKEIEEFLALEVSDAQFDSSGVFSLDESRSLDKLAAHQSERPGLWLVKLLQAAVALGCEEFRVYHLLGKTRVTFQPQRKAPWSEWREGLASQHPGLRHLQLALQAASTLPDCQLSFQLGDGLLWQVERGAAKLPLEPGQLGESVEIVRHWRFNLSLTGQLRRSRLQVDEGLLLQELGRYAPLAIRLDRRLLNDPVINKPPGLRLGVYVPPLQSRPRPAIPHTAVERIVVAAEPTSRCLALMDHSLRRPDFLERNRHLNHARGRHLFLQQWSGEDWLNEEDWYLRLRSRRAPFQEFDSRIERNDGLFEVWSDYNRHMGAILVQGYLSLDINRGREGRLYLVKDGLLMKPKTLPEELREVLIIWSAPDVNTDLGQLQVIEDEVYQAVWRTVLVELTQAAGSLLRLLNLHGLSAPEHAEYRDKARRVQRYLSSQALG